MDGGRGLWRRLRRLGRDPGYERSCNRWMAYRVVLGCDFRKSCISCPRVGVLENGLGWGGKIIRSTCYVVQMLW